jgi:hypothetical protein
MVQPLSIFQAEEPSPCSPLLTFIAFISCVYIFFIILYNHYKSYYYFPIKVIRANFLKGEDAKP